MGAAHILWDAPQVETLIRTRYSTIWDMYQQVRYPVMRVDIARIVILRAYGGLLRRPGHASESPVVQRGPHWLSAASTAPQRGVAITTQIGVTGRVLEAVS